ncbi:Ybp2p KNAG_0F02550 [Huiozyma naganishii CBS 8797]|uniref:Uncharacterized protein n=1 Tax=Huiozyma naganishii (strain ATCC MYA-139 / BCRC 22969 / CBS 8797 / KCTC 17520 / NBRC 10181 / NCYC 3082 / Yp74L-3) TaxID=1071383 RepID=J7R7R9_HUIN7|nr:hypothetical protein KNAG_0F02550 [Kazachstania naganishii CBS 8797]CCK70920.1 hypothetical protein KNAG_0F02550 [Kazachstania naganishii CBS 8797]
MADVDFETVLANLKRAFDEHSTDPVSLVTVIDLYADQINDTGTPEEIGRFLLTLYQLLQDNEAVLKEIAWDLPKTLLSFFNARNIDLHQKLTESLIIASVMKCFTEIALKGNPKECLLAGCELLTDLKFVTDMDDASATEESEGIDDDATDTESQDTGSDYTASGSEDQEDPQITASPADTYEAKNDSEFIPDIKVHLLFQLITTSLNRVESLYPSKFLSMAIASILRFLKGNIDLMENTAFVLRRINELVSSYHPTLTPYSNLLDVTKEVYDNLIEEEEQLREKLMGVLTTISVSLCFKVKDMAFDLAYYCTLADTTLDVELFDEEFKKLCCQCTKMVKTIPVQLEQEFSKLLQESKEIYNPVLELSEKPESEVTQMIYQLSYTFAMNKTLKETDMVVDPYGIIILSGMFYVEYNTHLVPKIAVGDAIYLFLRCATASLFSDVFNNKTVESTCKYWIWVSLVNNSIPNIKGQLTDISPIIIRTFLQILLVKNCAEKNEHVRTATFVLLTRILCILPEEMSYGFIFDTLLTCPYVHAKIIMIKVFKDLTQRNSNDITGHITRTSESANSVTNNISKLKISEDGKPARPALPPRPYIAITDDRMASIHSLAMVAVQNVQNDLETKQMSAIPLLLAYMNLFVGIRDKWNKDLLFAMQKSIDDKFKTHKWSSDGHPVPQLDFIKIANDTLKQYLNV